MTESPSGCPTPAVTHWLHDLARGEGDFARMLRTSNTPSASGFRHTIREICQQPATWAATARYLCSYAAEIAKRVDACRRIVLTGSGSSQYAAECAAPALSKDLRRPVNVAGGGELLLQRRASIAGEPTLVVSLARSGDSPESAAAVKTLLETEPQTEHLIITCNGEGALATSFAGNPRVGVIELGSHLNDRSLVMTTSFTNLVLGARFLGWTSRTDEFVRIVDRLDFAGRQLLTTWPDQLGSLVASGLDRVVFLGHGGRLGACREAALKTLEMTGGRLATMAETYLGLRHGPMCFVNERTLIVCLVSSDPLIRAYERDLIMELNAKKLGARKLIAGVGNFGVGLCGEQDLQISYEVPEPTDDDDLAILDVIIAQILGFYRSVKEGLEPDSPSKNAIISRVVAKFPIHRRSGALTK